MGLEDHIEPYLRAAILDAVREKPSLIEDERAHERSIMFRVGLRLAAAVEQWEGWKVDMEYNRMNSVTGRRIAKRVKRLQRADDDEARCVFPDLIVHKRRSSDHADNLLILEAKKRPCSGTDERFDEEKLAAYQAELNYQHAVLLKLAMMPTWDWRCGHAHTALVDGGSASLSS